MALLVVIGGLSALLGYVLGGPSGLAAAGLGGLFGLGLSALSHVLLASVKAAKGHAIQSRVMLGVIASFGLMIVFMVVVALLWREGLVAASLAAMAVYLAARFFEAFEANRGAPAPRGGGGAPPEPAGGGKGAR